jgi:hypothetical protein
VVQLVPEYQPLLAALGFPGHLEVQIGLSALVVQEVLVVPVVPEILGFQELLQDLVVQ